MKSFQITVHTISTKSIYTALAESSCAALLAAIDRFGVCGVTVIAKAAQ